MLQKSAWSKLQENLMHFPNLVYTLLLYLELLIEKLYKAIKAIPLKSFLCCETMHDKIVQ